MLFALGGCAHGPRPQPTLHSPPELSAPALSLLGYAYRLHSTSADGREAAVRTARQQVRSDPGALSYAYLAIALGTPHQHLYTPDEAARYARLALSSDDAPWDPDARQYLRDCLRLYRALSVSSRHTTVAVKNSRADAEHIAKLHTQLDQARAKLRALSHIEDRLDSAESQP